MDTPSMAAVLRFSRYRERPALAAAPAGPAPGATGPRCHCPCMARLEVGHGRGWPAGRDWGWRAGLGQAAAAPAAPAVLVASPTTQA